MDLTERVIWLSLGCAIGFVLGYIVRSLREIKEELDEVDVIVKQNNHSRNDTGLVRYPYVMDAALFIVVVVTVWAAFASAAVSSKLDNTVECLTEYNVGNARALASRDKAIRSETDSEIALWNLYDDLYKSAKENPDPKHLEKLQDQLARAIVSYRNDLIKTQATRDAYVYPDPNLVRNCKEK